MRLYELYICKNIYIYTVYIYCIYIRISRDVRAVSWLFVDIRPTTPES